MKKKISTGLQVTNLKKIPARVLMILQMSPYSLRKRMREGGRVECH